MPESQLEERVRNDNYRDATNILAGGHAAIGTVLGNLYGPQLLGFIPGAILGVPMSSIVLGGAGVLAGYYAIKGASYLAKKAYDKVSEFRLEEKVLNYASNFDKKASKIIPGLGGLLGGGYLAGVGASLGYAAGIGATIFSGIGGLALGAIAGYLALRGTYALTKGIVKTAYNTAFHPVRTFKNAYSNCQFSN